MYAIVKTGGKQYRVAEGDVISIEKLTGAPGDEVAFPAILLVDGDTMTHDADALAAVSVTGEVVAHTKGPKIKIHKYKNKTGYHKRMGHRQKHTEVKILSVGTGLSSTAPAARASVAPASATTATPASTATVTPASTATAAPAGATTEAQTSTATVAPISTVDTVTSTATTEEN